MNYGQIRIIAGQFRGRKIDVPDVPDLRPTPDRVRERLFNWLNPYLYKRNCLDLFAGTGILGLEALSRGARFTTFMDASPIAIAALKKSTEKLGITRSVELIQSKLPEGLSQLSKPFDLIFVDPPYQSNLLLPTIHALSPHLSPHALIYMESNRLIHQNELPSDLETLKSDHIGQVFHQLLRLTGEKT